MTAVLYLIISFLITVFSYLLIPFLIIKSSRNYGIKQLKYTAVVNAVSVSILLALFFDAMPLSGSMWVYGIVGYRWMVEYKIPKDNSSTNKVKVTPKRIDKQQAEKIMQISAEKAAVPYATASDRPVRIPGVIYIFAACVAFFCIFAAAEPEMFLPAIEGDTESYNDTVIADSTPAYYIRGTTAVHLDRDCRILNKSSDMPYMTTYGRVKGDDSRYFCIECVPEKFRK